MVNAFIWFVSLNLCVSKYLELSEFGSVVHNSSSLSLSVWYIP